MIRARGTVAEIDREALCHNLRALRAVGEGTELWPVIKADAYGHGLLPVGRLFEEEGVEGLCVALVEEGLALRERGVSVPILVLNGAYGRAHEEVLAKDLLPVVDRIEEIAAFAAVARTPFDFHLKVDTGMSRLGLPLAELDAFLEGLARHPSARLVGLMSHLSSADTDREYSERQRALFGRALEQVRRRWPAAVAHLANTAGLILHPRCRLDRARPGIGLYGAHPDEACAVVLESTEGAGRLRGALTLKSEVLHLHHVEGGTSVGYDRTYRAPGPRRIATIGIGYGDGVFRSLSGCGEVLIGGRRCPIVGRVSMDLIGVDVSALSAAEVGAPVVLIGEQGSERITVEEVAERAGTISYEVLTSITARVPRVYVG